MFGTKTKQVDLDKSTFNGLSYSLVRNEFNPNNQLFKVGLIFDLSEDRREKKLVEGHYVTVSRDSVVVENTSDTTVIVIPCNCDCDEEKKKQKTSAKTNESEEDNDDEDKSLLEKILESGTNGSGGSNSGGGKGSFPGVKSKPPVLK
jgi:hypothetical protein